MYKFFVNDKPLLLCKSKPSENRFDGLDTFEYQSPEKLPELIRRIEEQQTKGGILLCEDPTLVLTQLKSNFTIIHAGGGLVFNQNHDLLLMKRLGKWDLPKGKIDPGETTEEGAKREVQEECGIEELSIKRYFKDTFHTYKLQGHRFLKVSHWYEMDTPFNGALVPQIEESITEVKWEPFHRIDPNTLDTYESIRELLFDFMAAK
jgi:8-oxo-dGTP pyrophosphatase MutT (NUDIX family)